MIKQELLESRAFQKAGDDAKFFFLPLPYRGSRLFGSRLSTPLTVSHEKALIYFGRRGNPITKKELLSNDDFLKVEDWYSLSVIYAGWYYTTGDCYVRLKKNGDIEIKEVRRRYVKVASEQ